VLHHRVEGAFEVLDHRQFRAGEGAENEAVRDSEAGHPNTFPAKPRERDFKLLRRVDGTLDASTCEQFLRLADAIEFSRKHV
jgi:hypothetical protein